MGLDSISSYSFHVTRRTSLTSGLISTSAVSWQYSWAFLSSSSVIGIMFPPQNNCTFREAGTKKSPSSCYRGRGIVTRGTTSVWRSLTANTLVGYGKRALYTLSLLRANPSQSTQETTPFQCAALEMYSAYRFHCLAPPGNSL